MGYEREGGGTTTKWLKDRAHNIKIKVPVVHNPKTTAWLKAWKKNDRIVNGVFYTQKFGEICTTYTGKSLIFQLPILNFEDSEIALAEAGRIAQAMIEKYEMEVYELKLGDPDIKMQLISQHHAIPNEPYAKFCFKHGFSYKDEAIDIDASKSPELEFVDKNKSHAHHQNYIKYVKDFSTKDVPTASEVSVMIAQTQEQLKEIISCQVNTNMQLQTLATSVKLLVPENEEPQQTNKERCFYIG